MFDDEFIEIELFFDIVIGREGNPAGTPERNEGSGCLVRTLALWIATTRMGGDAVFILGSFNLN